MLEQLERIREIRKKLLLYYDYVAFETLVLDTDKRKILGFLLILEMLEKDLQKNRINMDELECYLACIPDNPPLQPHYFDAHEPFPRFHRDAETQYKALIKYPHKYSTPAWVACLILVLVLANIGMVSYFGSVGGLSLKHAMAALFPTYLGIITLLGIPLYYLFKKYQLWKILHLVCLYQELTPSENQALQDVLGRIQVLNPGPENVEVPPLPNQEQTRLLAQIDYWPGLTREPPGSLYYQTRWEKQEQEKAKNLPQESANQHDGSQPPALGVQQSGSNALLPFYLQGQEAKALRQRDADQDSTSYELLDRGERKNKEHEMRARHQEDSVQHDGPRPLLAASVPQSGSPEGGSIRFLPDQSQQRGQGQRQQPLLLGDHDNEGEEIELSRITSG